MSISQARQDDVPKAISDILAGTDATSVAIAKRRQRESRRCFLGLGFLLAGAMVIAGPTMIGLSTGMPGRGDGVFSGLIWPIVVGSLMLLLGICALLYICSKMRSEYA